MAKANKIKKEELKSIQEVNKKLTEGYLIVGQIESDKLNALNMLRVNQAELEKLKEKLKKDYGDVSIDITTGEIKENE